MSALDKLGHSLTEAISKILKAPVVDEAAVKELIRDFQRALLQADVNVNLVLDLSKRIEQRSLEEKPPPGITRREQIVNVIYQELTNFVGESLSSRDPTRKTQCLHACRHTGQRQDHFRSETCPLLPEERP